MNNCLGVVVIVLILLTAVVLVYAEPPADLYCGSSYDGYDVRCATNKVIPPLPPTGTVMAIR